MLYANIKFRSKKNSLKPREAFNLTQKIIKNKSEVINLLFNPQNDHFLLKFYLQIKIYMISKKHYFMSKRKII